MSFCNFGIHNLYMRQMLYTTALLSTCNPFSAGVFSTYPRYNFMNYSMNYIPMNNYSLYSNFNSMNNYYQPSYYSYSTYTPTFSYNPYSAYGSYNLYKNTYSPYNYSSNFNYTNSNIYTDKSLYSSNDNTNRVKTEKVPKTKNQSAWEKIGYSAKKGMALAKNALSHAVGFTGYCAKYVKNAICNTGLGEYESGNACDMAAIMRNNKNFKELNPNKVDVNNLPAGCVLVYDRGVAGYSSKYGHTEITDGKGRGVSDGITNNLRKPSAIFMPVAA